MAYNKKNRLKRIALIQAIVQQHYVPGVTHYKGIFEKYVKHIYPMSYATFIEYINTVVPKEPAPENKPDQLKLFEK
jgi:hypothetical protein